jgi:co-chaperonin GroES (HSP10)
MKDEPLSLSGFEPVANYILLEPKLSAEVSQGGIIIPEQSRQSLTQGTIVKKGANVTRFDIGDEVVFKQHAEDRLEIDGKHFLFLDDSAVIMHRKKKSEGG